MTLPAAEKVAQHEAKKKATKAAAKKATDKATDKASDKASHESGGKKSLITFPASKTKDALKLSFDNKYAPAQKPYKSVVTSRHVLALEFWVGLIAILTEHSSLNKKDVEVPDSNSMVVEAGAFVLVFAGLFGVTAGGREAARVASALGGLIVLVLIMKQEYFRSQNNVASRFGFFKPDITQNNPYVNEPGNVSTAPTTSTKGEE